MASGEAGAVQYDALVRLRVEVHDSLQQENPRFQCAWCWTPAYIVASSHKRFFFRHTKEDGSCAAVTRGVLSADEIMALKYHGQREGKPHKRIKNLIDRSLAADPAFSSVALETSWRAARDPKARRQPDVQAIFGEMRLAFEVQLSTTFLSVVAGRRTFYRQEGGLLIWVLGHFTPDYRRMTTDDLLFSNNSNILVVDEATTAISEDSGAFHVRCHYRRPMRTDTGGITDAWDERIVPFRELTLDQEGQRAYIYDFDAEEKALRAILEAEEHEAWLKADDDLRTEFFALWNPPKDANYDDLKQRWSALSDTLEARDIAPLGHYSDRHLLEPIIHAMLSAKEGMPVGWRFKTLAEVSHHLASKHKNCLLAFGYAINAYGNSDTLKASDQTGKLESKLDLIRRAMRSYDPDYLPDEDWLNLVCFLFPEVHGKLYGYMERKWARQRAQAALS